jgi:hypothetical protein
MYTHTFEQDVVVADSRNGNLSYLKVLRLRDTMSDASDTRPRYSPHCTTELSSFLQAW